MRKLLLGNLFGGSATEMRPTWRRGARGSWPRPRARSPAVGLDEVSLIREVDAGSCNACELEIHALNDPYTISSDSASALSLLRDMRTYCSLPAQLLRT